jgi:hypothetical protein
MTDKELLELAAQAAGYKWREDIAEERDKLGVISLWIIDPMKTAWNPLESDGDALRLAVQLSFTVKVYGNHSWVKGFDSSCCHDDYDPYAATRRAIVRAAAEIGKGV